jgi:threonylcarbamoyladenosine tRNA methylthiotransferase CDKAL1
MQSCLWDPRNGEIILSRLKGKNVHIQTFGCTFNRLDSQRLAHGLLAHGCSLVSAEDADLIVVNTCTVVGKTERKVLRYLRSHRQKELYVMGCMLPVQEEEILSVCSPQLLPKGILHFIHPSPGTLMGGTIGAIQIAEGCNGSCTYCVARIVRGPLSSHPPDVIKTMLHRLVAQGAREIQLSAMDVAAWGRDRGESLITLLDDCTTEPGDFFLRLGMMNPASLLPILEELIPHLEGERIYQFLHLPLQSGSDTILRAMQRGYTVDQYLTMVQELREHIPDLWLTTDVIAGFPGETEEDHRQTLEALQAIRPNKVNITRFSPRPCTLAQDLPDLLERRKKERSRHLTARATAICRENNAPWIHRIVPAWAAERIRPGSTVCRTREYRSIVVKKDLPQDWKGRVRILEDRIHYFLGSVEV